jgi:DNA-binding transcriptional LysR family regulator
MSLSSLDDLLLFVTLVESETFTHAAKKLGLPKSKLSRHIAQLEKQLGSQLLIRTTRRQQLTESGQHLYQSAKPHIEALAKVEDDIGTLINLPKGKINILLPLEFFNKIISALITDFSYIYPNISIHCHHYSGVLNEADYHYDLIFVLHETPLPASNWIAKELISFPQSVYTSQKRDTSHINHPEDLMKEQCILSTEQQQWYFRDNNKVQSVLVSGRVVLSSPEMQIVAGQRDLGIVKLPDYVCQLTDMSPCLKPIKLSKQPIAQQLTIMYQSRSIPIKTRVFIDYFQSNIGKLSF